MSQLQIDLKNLNPLASVYLEKSRNISENIFPKNSLVNVRLCYLEALHQFELSNYKDAEGKLREAEKILLDNSQFASKFDSIEIDSLNG